MNKKKTLRLTVLCAAGALLLAVPFLTGSYVQGVCVSILITVMLGQSWNLMSGYAGQFSFGHAAFFGLGAYTSSLCYVNFGLSPWIGMLLGMAVAAAVGALIGYLSFRCKLKGDYFALATLAFAEIFRVLFNNIPALGGASGVLLPFVQDWKQFQFADKAAYYYTALALAALMTGFIAFISKKRLGLSLVAVKTNPEAAGALGVDVAGCRLGAIALSAAMAGMAGTFYAQYYSFIDPSVAFSAGVSVRAIVPCLIGGAGTVFGPILGALVIVPVQELCNGVFSGIGGLNMIVYGVLIVVFILFCPGGLLRAARGLRQKRLRRKGGEP